MAILQTAIHNYSLIIIAAITI